MKTKITQQYTIGGEYLTPAGAIDLRCDYKSIACVLWQKDDSHKKLAVEIAHKLNCHDKLVEALQRLLRAFQADFEKAPELEIQICWETNSMAIQQACEAIALAGK